VVKLNARELRTYEKDQVDQKNKKDKIKKNPIYIILDNVLDTYNIGSIFRLADAVAAEKIIICGQSEVPPNTRIKKASINTTVWVEWEYISTAVEAISKLRREIGGIRVIGIEQGEKSVLYTEVKLEFPMALVVGNETNGISQGVLDVCDQMVEIPMWGVNKSLNVMVSLAIVLYKIMEDAQTSFAP